VMAQYVGKRGANCFTLAGFVVVALLGVSAGCTRDQPGSRNRANPGA
jgi:hypothetical protein